jgi:hypothetical protein
MPKLNRFTIEVETGEIGADLPVHFTINNHKMPLEDTQGGVGPTQIFSGGFEIGSFVHSLTLVGPETGQWDICKMTVGYDCEHTPPYSVTFDAFKLDETTEVNIWQDPPLPTWDV